MHTQLDLSPHVLHRVGSKLYECPILSRPTKSPGKANSIVHTYRKTDLSQFKGYFGWKTKNSKGFLHGHIFRLELYCYLQ